MFSLLMQGFTISPLLRWLRFTQPPPQLMEYELLQSQLLAETSALAEIDAMRSQGRLAEPLHQRLRTELAQTQQELSQQLAQLDSGDPSLEQQRLRRIQQHLINVKKTRLTELLQEGMLSETTYQELNKQLDESMVSSLFEPPA